MSQEVEVTAGPGPGPVRDAAAQLRADKQENIEADLQAWYSYSTTVAAKMSDDYALSQSHILNLMFQAGAKVIHSRNPNVYNAWLHRRADEVNDGLPKGERMKLSEIQEQYGEEYYELTDEQKFELMEGLMDDRDTNFKGARLTSRGRLKTLSSVMQNIEKQYAYLKLVCGIDAMSLIVRNDPSFHFDPISSGKTPFT
ncbi:hypothetical protein FOMPIDRAFT_1056553 [Fomitopsis schrenkii]|uniref:Uncharacterized protein n=1 Tax=Fomitopsis schrenkii TaxID=2126942 RepID=S8DGY7_FOMSC|nr:hypothetical protein FOMPIDRAFT_1056553 [Fomitopsis schrenkii]